MKFGRAARPEVPEIAALILAAGRSTRFAAGATKALALWRGKPLAQWVAEAALGSQAGVVVAVTGHAALQVRDTLEPLGVRCVHNPAYAEGMASSLKTGIAALPSHIAGVVVLLADMPLVTSRIVDQVIACFTNAGSAADFAVPVCGGRHGNPVLLGAAVLPAIASLNGDEGARSLLKMAGCRTVLCPIEDDAILRDVDTMDALAALSHEDG